MKKLFYFMAAGLLLVACGGGDEKKAEAEASGPKIEAQTVEDYLTIPEQDLKFVKEYNSDFDRTDVTATIQITCNKTPEEGVWFMANAVDADGFTLDSAVCIGRGGCKAGDKLKETVKFIFRRDNQWEEADRFINDVKGITITVARE